MALLTIETPRNRCPDVPGELVRAHLERPDDAYFNTFSVSEIASHLAGLTNLGPDRVAKVLFDDLPNGQLSCTLLAFDHPFLFTAITNVLTSLDFSISNGDAFTYRPEKVAAPPKRRGRRRVSLKESHDATGRCRIVDRFIGRVKQRKDLDAWKGDLVGRLSDVIRTLGEDQRLDEAKRKLNEMVSDWLGRDWIRGFYDEYL